MRKSKTRTRKMKSKRKMTSKRKMRTRKTRTRKTGKRERDFKDCSSVFKVKILTGLFPF